MRSNLLDTAINDDQLDTELEFAADDDRVGPKEFLHEGIVARSYNCRFQAS